MKEAINKQEEHLLLHHQVSLQLGVVREVIQEDVINRMVVVINNWFAIKARFIDHRHHQVNFWVNFIIKSVDLIIKSFKKHFDYNLEHFMCIHYRFKS